MLRYAQPLEAVIHEFERLPGIGPKSAQRLAMHLMQVPPEDVAALAEALLALRESVGECRQCFNYAQDELCPVCHDPTRDRGMLCVVETPVDLMALERAGEYGGLHHVLGGVLSPMQGIGHEDLRVDALLARVTAGQVREVILATSPTVEGDATAEYLRGLLEEYDVAVTRIALGLPVGGDLDYADHVTVARALRGRRPMGET